MLACEHCQISWIFQVTRFFVHSIRVFLSPFCEVDGVRYCENGSLHSICKNFGKFPENLVALYINQVLQGLVYLHEQGVIHRDIKGANILTTKEGLVKLADFGVATKTSALSDVAVVGSPYWSIPPCPKRTLTM